MQSLHSSFHAESDSVLSNGINGVTFRDEKPKMGRINSTNRSSSMERRVVKTTSRAARENSTPRTVGQHRSETGNGWRESGQSSVSEHRNLARGRKPKTSHSYSNIVTNKPLSSPEKRSVDRANPPRVEDDRRKYTGSLPSESHDAGSSGTASKMDMLDQHTPRKLTLTSVSPRYPNTFKYGVHVDTKRVKQNVEDGNGPSRKESSPKTAELQSDSSFEKNPVLPEIGNGGKHEADGTQFAHISSHGNKTIGLTDEMPHTSFMEASRRNIASSLSSMSAARRRLDRSTELLRPTTVPNFPTVHPPSVYPPGNNLKIIKTTSGGTNDVILFRKRSQSVPDVVSPRAPGANRPPRAAWKPARNSQPKSNKSRSATVTMKEEGPSWSVNSSSEFPLLTGKNELVLFEPGVVFFEDSISSNTYYDSLFKTVRRSMYDIGKHKNNNVNGK